MKSVISVAAAALALSGLVSAAPAAPVTGLRKRADPKGVDVSSYQGVSEI